MDGRPRYLVTGDMNLLVRRWAEAHRFASPDRHFFGLLMRELVDELSRIFEPRGIDVQFISWAEMKRRLTTLIEEHSADRPPIISLDPVYVDGADMQLSTNRLAGYSKHSKEWTDLGKGPRPGSSMMSVQLAQIAGHSSVVRAKRVIIVDDGVWTGGTLATIDKIFGERGIRVEKFLVALQIRQTDPSPELRSIEARIVPHPDGDYAPGDVLDYICERDFYVGIPYSGRTLGLQVPNGVPGPKTAIDQHYPNMPMKGNFGAPYFAPLGDAAHWASIPEEEVVAFSRFCLMQSRKLYERIERESSTMRGHKVVVRVCDLERPPLFYVKPDVRVIDEIDVSLRKLS